MSRQSALERRYRRLLACYPRAFRRAHEEEMLTVLLACSPDGRRRPGVPDTVDLLSNALSVRLRPQANRSLPSVFWAVRLMVLAAALELAALVVVLASRGAVHAAVLHQFPHFSAGRWSAVVNGQITPAEIGAPVAAVGWLMLAFANDRGHRWARVGVVALTLLTSLSLSSALVDHAATYAPADLGVAVGLTLSALTATLMIVSPDSNRHYDGDPHPGRLGRLGRQAAGSG